MTYEKLKSQLIYSPSSLIKGCPQSIMPDKCHLKSKNLITNINLILIIIAKILDKLHNINRIYINS
jgi:hypothetical protein